MTLSFQNSKPGSIDLPLRGPSQEPLPGCAVASFLTVLRHLPFHSELGYAALQNRRSSDGGRLGRPGPQPWLRLLRKQGLAPGPPAPCSPVMSRKCLPWAPASSTPARRRDERWETELLPTLLRWLPRGLARGRAAQTHPGRGQTPAGGPVSPLPPLQGASPNADSRAPLLDRHPGMRMFSKHARRLRVRALGRQGWEFRAGLSLESKCWSDSRVTLRPPPSLKIKTKRLRSSGGWEDF